MNLLWARILLCSWKYSFQRVVRHSGRVQTFLDSSWAAHRGYYFWPLSNRGRLHFEQGRTQSARATRAVQWRHPHPERSTLGISSVMSWAEPFTPLSWTLMDDWLGKQAEICRYSVHSNKNEWCYGFPLSAFLIQLHVKRVLQRSAL